MPPATRQDMAAVCYFNGDLYMAMLGTDHVPYYKGPDTHGEWSRLKGWFIGGLGMAICDDADKPDYGEVSIVGIGSDHALWRLHRPPGGQCHGL